jgi:fermentation-respiration switch protein FrsA (DUF1100 family)
VEVIHVAGSATEERAPVGIDAGRGPVARRAVGRAHRFVLAVLVAVGVSFAVFVGRDGSPGWQLVRIAVVGALGTLAVVGSERPTTRGRGWIRAVAGVVSLAVGAGFLPYVAKDTASLEAAAAVVAVLGGLVLTVAGTVVSTRGRGGLRRAVSGVGAFLAVALVAYVVGPAVAATNVPRPRLDASPDSVGLRYEDARLTTDDGVALAGWYVPSTNRAAVVLLHGAGSTRSDVLQHAVVLARHGFGVLMIDARGHGESGGRAMDFGWHGDEDVAAATAFLAGRADVDDERIGVVGLSMGGEEAIGASAADARIRAVVAEGATARAAADEGWLSDEYGLRGWFTEQLERLQDWVTDALTSASVPTALRTAVTRSGSTEYLLIAAGKVADEAHAAAYIAGAAPDRVQTWTVEGAGHTDGLTVAPDEWERRVTMFLADALLPGVATNW